MGRIIDVVDADFEKEVLQADKPVLVDFWATWCGPCKMLAPTIEAVAATFENDIKFVKVNVEQSPDTARRYGVSSIPCLLLFKNGDVYRPMRIANAAILSAGLRDALEN